MSVRSIRCACFHCVFILFWWPSVQLFSALHIYHCLRSRLTTLWSLFDTPTTACNASFPIVDISPQGRAETRLFLENKSSFLLFCTWMQGDADLPSVYSTGSGCPTVRDSESCSNEQGANGMGLVLKIRARTHTNSSAHTLHWRNKPLECIFLRGHREDDIRKGITVWG